MAKFPLKGVALGVATTALLVSVSACSSYNDTRGIGDAAVTDGFGHQKGNDNPKLVTNFPDRFSNVATSCVAPGFRAFVTTSTGATGRFIVLPDEKCNGYSDAKNLYKG